MRSTIVGRLVLAFGVNLALFAVAVTVLVRATSQLDAADAEVARLDRAKDAGHRVSALVREQYIHQAHTIIEGNRSHVDHYDEIARAARAAIALLHAVAERSDDRELADDIAARVRQNDDEFRTLTLPAIDRGDQEKVRELHAATELVVVQALQRSKELNGRFERRGDEARGRADRMRQRTRTTALICFGLSALLAVIVSIATTRWIASRVSALRGGARAIGAGDLKSRIALDGADEFADIARSFNEMADGIERHHEEILRAHKLASIGQVAAGVAHEINNPLGVILGYVKTMRRREGRDDEGLDVVEEEATQCKRIVEGLLDLARPQQLTTEQFDLGALVRESLDRLAATGKLGGRVVDGPRGDCPLLVAGDPGQLRQVFLNVLTNAAEAAPNGGSIAVDLAAASGEAVVEVRDSGPGIAADVRARLFEPFFTTKTKTGGVGLGLAIAQAIVEAHRGSISCEDGARGGTVIRIMLPLGTTARPA